MHPLYTVSQLRHIEQNAAATLAPGTLMQRAGRAAAELALELIAGQVAPRVLLLAGPGNNGGDALEVAAHLADAGVDVCVRHFAAPAAPSPEAGAALGRAIASGAQFSDTVPAAAWHLVVDGLFGIGLQRPLEGALRDAALMVNSLRCPLLALDVPSGLDADTGAIVGPDGLAVRATHTITFIGDKPGLHTCEGREYAGSVTLASLAIDSRLFPQVMACLGGPELFAAWLRARPQNSHKGSFGNVAVVGGAQGMAGAPVLAARGALHAGAGRVFVAWLDPGPGFDSAQPELMFRNAAEFDLSSATIVAGPGMGTEHNAARLVAAAIDCASPLVLDADALNLIAASGHLQATLAQHKGPCVLTPHPLEAARLLGASSATVQGDRLAAARELAVRLNACVVLKGSGTVIARPDGFCVVNPTGNAGLATAGTGDVLAGICGGLLAQGWPTWEAALAAVWLHGLAADRLVEQGCGPIGLTASELPLAVRALLNAAVRPGGLPRS